MEKKKVLVLGIDGLDPRLTRKYIAEGVMPNTKKFLEKGAANVDLEMIGGQPTVTPPMWTTLATGATVRVHGITGYYRHNDEHKDILEYNFDSTYCKAEQMWNVTAEAGLKTLVWHWPGSSWPPSSDSENLHVIDGTQPGGINVGTAQVEPDMLMVASPKVEKVSFRTKAASDAEVPCFIAGMEAEEESKDGDLNMMINRLTVKKSQRVTMTIEENIMNLSETPMDMVSSPIKPATGWVDAPADALETTMLLASGYIHRPCLILKNAEGKYDKVAIYKNKKATEPIVVLEKDVFVQDIVDESIRHDERILVNRSMRIIELKEDGSSLRIWISAAMDFNDDTVWSPKSLLKTVVENVGYPQPVCLAGGSDETLISKCMRASWDHSADWNAAGIKYMAREQGYDVIFSHFHNVDMQGHMLVQYLKKGSKLAPEVLQRLFKDVYIQTDNYIGEFLEMIDEGWTILMVSDHGQTTPEHDTSTFRLNTGGVNAYDMRKLGYTVLKKDENGNDIPEIDWSKTTAHTASYCHIFLNIKGRNPYGIVEPEDQFELEERIMTDLYSLRDEKTGHRIVALALRNKDAVLLGEGGPDSGDIIYYIAEGYSADHSDTFSTIDGACDTSVRSIFMAAGPGIKENYLTERIVKHMDITPTVATLLGTRMPAQCEGAP
ncbi:MAG: alkaline phosphatase family protein, partial [Peptococcaceae bacterium]|nr:alkaline phosphatase family protein [Peptococcaceae bacterium]